MKKPAKIDCNPPKEKEMIDEIENVSQETDILDFNELDIDYLAEDFLDNEADLEFTELDINYLDTNFLEDLLDIIDELAIAEEEDQLALATSTIISGTALGQDPDTQIITFIDGEIVNIQRSVTQTANLRLNIANSYTVIFIQDGVSKTIKINGGSSSTITIRQSAG